MCRKRPGETRIKWAVEYPPNYTDSDEPTYGYVEIRGSKANVDAFLKQIQSKNQGESK